MTYNILNTKNGDCTSMKFNTETELNEWLDKNNIWENLGPADGYLPTRHVRMQSEEFAGWGS